MSDSGLNISAEQLAELLGGIARAQSAIIDAVERANGGWRNSHLLPLLTVAANMRTADPRLLDLPSRILLRAQGRGALDIAAIVADLNRLTGDAPAQPAAAPASVAPATARAAAAAASAAAPAAASAPATPPAAAAPAADSGLDFSAKP
jgi:hypothetical protein